MDRAGLRDLFDYTSFTWSTYGNAIAHLPPGTFMRSFGEPGWRSLRDALFHVASGWDDWLRDRLGVVHPLGATAESIASWVALQVHRERTRGWLRRVIEETPDAELDAREVEVFQGMRVSVAEVLTHILLHERAHHGDINGLLERAGAQLPGSDYLVYVFFRDRAASAG